MPNIKPSLWFDDNLEEAMEFYTKLFPSSSVGQVLRYGPAGPGPEGTVMTAEFNLDGNEFNGINGGPLFKFTEAVSFIIECADQEEMDHYWYALTADGGEESQCGWCKDKFGLSWQIVPKGWEFGDMTPSQMEAMFKMTRLVLADLEAAK